MARLKNDPVYVALLAFLNTEIRNHEKDLVAHIYAIVIISIIFRALSKTKAFIIFLFFLLWLLHPMLALITVSLATYKLRYVSILLVGSMGCISILLVTCNQALHDVGAGKPVDLGSQDYWRAALKDGLSRALRG